MDFHDLLLKCRACLGVDGKMMSLYEESYSESIYKSLMSFASISIIKNDGGPTNICHTCLNKLNDTLKFKVQCENADKQIQKLLINLNTTNTAESLSTLQSKEGALVIKDELIKQEIRDNYTDESVENCLLDTKNILDHDSLVIGSRDIGLSKELKIFNDKPEKMKKKHKRKDNLSPNEVVIHANNRKRGRPPKMPLMSAEGQMCCSICKKIFLDIKSFEKHSNCHTKARDFSCEQCGKQFKYRDNLKTHIMIHSGEKPFKCDICNKTFAKKDNLQTHIRRHLKQREWSCEVCGSSYYTSYELKTHTRTHTGEKPHVCTLCGKRFTAKNNLYIHLRTHSGEKPHVCTVCGKQFISKNILTIHSRTHTGEKPYICSVCGKRFTANKLAVHMRIHTGERPHVCSLCGKQFSASNVLMIHMRRHTGEKPYECKVCGQAYGHTQSLNKHMRKQHKIVTNQQQLKMKQINEAHQALINSKDLTMITSKSENVKSINVLDSHKILIKPLLLHSTNSGNEDNSSHMPSVSEDTT